MSNSLDVDRVVASAWSARERIAPHLRRTPWEHSVAASREAGATVWLKHEQQQVTGSFKPRGSLTKLSRLSEQERGGAWRRRRPGTTGSGGPTRPPASRCRPGSTCLPTRTPAYNDPDMVVGAATLGLEVAEEMPDLDVLLVPIGGGGLAAGTASALATGPTEVWAVATAASRTWLAWHAAGKIGPVELRPSVAEGLSGPIEPGTVTFPLVRDLVPRVLGADEPQLAGAMAWLARTHQQLAEPSGVAALAAALDPRSGLSGARVGVLLTGRNVALRRFLDLVAPYADEPR